MSPPLFIAYELISIRFGCLGANGMLSFEPALGNFGNGQHGSSRIPQVAAVVLQQKLKVDESTSSHPSIPRGRGMSAGCIGPDKECVAP